MTGIVNNLVDKPSYFSGRSVVVTEMASDFDFDAFDVTVEYHGYAQILFKNIRNRNNVHRILKYR